MTPRAASSAKTARVRSPGERERPARRTSSAPRPNFASSVRASSGGRPARPTNSSRSAPDANSPRSWSSRPSTTPGPTQRVPCSSGVTPSIASSSVVLPLPFGPVTARRSPHPRSRSSGPRVKSPRVTTAFCSRTTISPLRSRTPSPRRSSHGSYGFSTCPSRSMRPPIALFTSFVFFFLRPCP